MDFKVRHNIPTNALKSSRLIAYQTHVLLSAPNCDALNQQLMQFFSKTFNSDCQYKKSTKNSINDYAYNQEFMALLDYQALNALHLG